MAANDDIRPQVTVVIVAYGEEPLLVQSVSSVLNSQGVDVDVILVDNGCTNPALLTIDSDPRVRRVMVGRNTGFAGGVNIGAGAAAREFLCLINSDALVHEDALAVLAGRASNPQVGIVTAGVRLLSDPERMNSAGNPLHVLGFVWAGGLGDLYEEHARSGPVATASGAAMMMRRSTWDVLGGFEERFFMYSEDVDLSIASWQHGMSVVYEPAAIVWHDYSMNWSAARVRFADRNRLIVVLTRFPLLTLVLLLPLIVAAEVGTLVIGGLPSARRAKLNAWAWLIRNVRWLIRRRRRLSARMLDPAGFVPHMTTSLAGSPAAGVSMIADRVVGLYLRAVRRAIRPLASEDALRGIPCPN